MTAPGTRARLVTVAHGTRNVDGPLVVRALNRRVAARLPDVDVMESYVELNEPTLASTMASSEVPTVVAPLLLSTGFHVKHDLPDAAAHSPAPVRICRPLGPHPLLAAAGALRLRAAGASRADAVVLVVAGSRDPEADGDGAAAARLLRAQWGSPVRPAFLSGAGPSVGDVVAQLRAEGSRRVVASPYLLAPGHFASRARRLAAENGVTVVADVLGDHPLVAEIVVRRYLRACRAFGARGRRAASRRAGAA